MQYFTLSREVILGEVIGKGGEGDIYEISNHTSFVAKVYHSVPQLDWVKKMQYMINHPPNLSGFLSVSAMVAWPLEILYNTQNKPIGFVMIRVQDPLSLFKVINPRIRKRDLPGFSLRYRHRAALNIAWSMAQIHKAGYVIGDVNESNWLVNTYGGVTLIDTDSIQVKYNINGQSLTFPCPVGKADYTAPEIQCKHFSEVYRNKNHDHFALAVLIYQLLSNGNHPFRLHWKGEGDSPSYGESISAGYFPYGNTYPDKVAPPETSYTLEALHPGLRGLIMQCFSEGHMNPYKRPSAQEWFEVLKHIDKCNDITSCVCGNHYYKSSGFCPNCKTRPVFVSIQKRTIQQINQVPLLIVAWNITVWCITVFAIAFAVIFFALR